MAPELGTKIVSSNCCLPLGICFYALAGQILKKDTGHDGVQLLGPAVSWKHRAYSTPASMGASTCVAFPVPRIRKLDGMLPLISSALVRGSNSVSVSPSPASPFLAENFSQSDRGSDGSLTAPTQTPR